MIQPIVILADDYAAARAWAIRRGLPSAAYPMRNREGESWIYAYDLDRLLGRRDGRFVDLRSLGVALGDRQAALRPALLAAGFHELPRPVMAEPRDTTEKEA